MLLNSILNDRITEVIRNPCHLGDSADRTIPDIVATLTRNLLTTINLFDFVFFLFDEKAELPDHLMLMLFKIKSKFLSESQLQQVIVEGLLADSNSGSCLLETHPLKLGLTVAT